MPRKRTRSPNFVVSVDARSPTGESVLRGVRTVVARLNRERRAEGESGTLRVSLSRRLGKPNPNAWKYDNRFKPRLREEDAQVTDVYVAVPKGMRRRHQSRKPA